jgi:DNA-binding FadR family transcriptional regulator
VERDTNFHLQIAMAAENSVLMIMLSAVGELLRESRRRTFVVPGELARARSWHHTIFEAIGRGDGEAARQAMAAHMGQVEGALQEYQRHRRGRDTESA